MENMNFGQALEAVKSGKKIAREGWNGKNMFVYFVPSETFNTLTDIAKKEFGNRVTYNAYLAIKNVNGTVSTWVPSINDVLSEDWKVIQ